MMELFSLLQFDHVKKGFEEKEVITIRQTKNTNKNINTFSVSLK